MSGHEEGDCSRRRRRRRSSSSCCCCSRVERANELAAVQQFQVFANIEALVTSMRAERGYTTSVVILGGQDAAANEEMFKQRSRTDYILLSLPVWPDGLAINGVRLTTKLQLEDMLNALRGKVSTHSVDYHDVLDFYSDITQQFMYWLLVICTPLYYGYSIVHMSFIFAFILRLLRKDKEF